MTNVRRGIPKRDGSGRGIRANRGRSGCTATQKIGRGSGTTSGRGRRGGGFGIQRRRRIRRST